MKELWEAEGTVVISRNVDVLVSKLRKKLSDDHDLKFVNVHGRGYKLVAE
jgi:DNA-binding response OmpR family regulator